MKSARAMAVLVICLVAWGLAAPAATAATVGGRKAPALDKPRQGDTSLVFTGKARPRASVRLQVRARAGWKAVAQDRASRRGTFRITLGSPVRTRQYRVVSDGRTSRARAVAPVPTVEAAATAKPKPKPTDACGTVLDRPGGGTYQCSLVDQFDGTALDERYWHVMDGTSTGAACMVDTPQTVAVSGGSLRLTARPVARADQCPLRKDGTRASYVTGSVNTFWKWSQQYGRFEARMKSQAVSFAGPQEAFWLWPDTRYSSDTTWPASGEIDIVENYAAYPHLAIPFLHYTWNDNGGPVPGLNTAWNCLAPRGQWHTYALEWTAERLTISVDGRTCLTNTAGAASFRKRFIMSFSQLLSGSGVNTFLGGVVPSTTLEVDYVKVWK
ncbi:glycoside hydrolase family 16 protein [Nocardioides sp. LHD-245]|uniref:glycoside hydrolase family 16 protein n=1 Tax=Nocardioides sp. LHD-245 TaxID=3051387 RepID=UPI0027DFD8DC|nr:glycoside hydrolase family 16 protein [Nocardioides sp. LHD-245]